MEGFSYDRKSILEKYDSTPTANSTNLVDSGAIKNYVDTEVDSIDAKVDDMIDRVGNPFTFKGTVSALSNLPSTGNTTNDTYFVEAEGFMYTWNGSSFTKSSSDVNNQLARDIATEYSTTKSNYKKGDFVLYNNQTYVRKEDATGAEGTFVTANWTAVSIADHLVTFKGEVEDDLTNLKSALNYAVVNEPSVNKIDPSKITTGYLGQTCVLKTNAGKITDFIPVEGNSVYTANNLSTGDSSSWVSWFFSDAEISSHISKIPSLTFTTPQNCKYVRLVYSGQSQADTAMLVEGETLPSSYIPYVEDTYRLSQEVEETIETTAKDEIDKYLEIGGYNFFDDNFGRCSVNNSTGKVTKSETGNMIGSGYFRVFPYVPYKSSNYAWNYCFLYDENMEFLGIFNDNNTLKQTKSNGSDPGTVFVITNKDAKYCILTTTYSGSDPSSLYVRLFGDIKSTRYFPSTNVDNKQLIIGGSYLPMYGKKWVALGDSITAGEGLINNAFSRYTSLIMKNTGIIAYNYGISGSRITASGESGSSTYDNAMVVRYTEMVDDVDYVTVFGGINDANNSLPIGELGDTSIYTFYGALDTLIRGLIDKYSDSGIGFITPLHYGISSTHEQYVNAMKTVCAKYAIPVLDLYNCGQLSTITQDINQTYYSDGLHPNELGQSVISRKVYNFLNSL